MAQVVEKCCRLLPKQFIVQKGASCSGRFGNADNVNKVMKTA